MKKQTKTMLYAFTMTGLCVLLSSGCKKNDTDDTTTPVAQVETGYVSDFDGNSYKTVKAGTQWWMAQDLKTTKLNDGTPIPVKPNNADWINTTEPAMCYYNNDSTNASTYGALYNYYTVTNTKICPIGWHIPTHQEWTTLATTLGGDEVAGGKMKETGTSHWNTPNTGATNDSKFTALPSGNRSDQGNYSGLHNYSLWWTCTPYSDGAWARNTSYGDGTTSQSCKTPRNGLSVRCVRD
jgi:uncharacterized protein (TIGR02145 family)